MARHHRSVAWGDSLRSCIDHRNRRNNLTNNVDPKNERRRLYDVYYHFTKKLLAAAIGAVSFVDTPFWLYPRVFAVFQCVSQGGRDAENDGDNERESNGVEIYLTEFVPCTTETLLFFSRSVPAMGGSKVVAV